MQNSSWRLSASASFLGSVKPKLKLVSKRNQAFSVWPVDRRNCMVWGSVVGKWFGGMFVNNKQNKT